MGAQKNFYGGNGKMVFSKSFAKTIEGEKFPKWEEIILSNEEEAKIELEAKEEHIIVMIECIEDAKKILKERRLEWETKDMVGIAVALFEKRASHVIYYKENKAKEKFDETK